MDIRAKQDLGDLRDGGAGQRKADRVHLTLKNAIMLGVHAPGTQLLEQSLAAGFACSQGTVREALQKLAEEGLVERRGYGGTFVTETTLAEAAEMVRLRLRIERSAARRLAGSGADTGPAERITRLMDEARAADDVVRGAELDRAFHAGLAQAAGLGLVAPILRRCALHMHRFTLSGAEVPRRFCEEAGVGEEHRALLAALTGADPDAAERAAVGHLETVLRRWTPALHEAVGAAAFA